MQKGSST